MGSRHDESHPPSEGTRASEEQLFAAVAQQLRTLAAQLLRGERRSPTFTTSDLVSEACASVLASSRSYVVDEGALRALAGRAMRQVLVERARRTGAQKRIRRECLVDLQELDLRRAHWDEDVLLLDQLLALISRKVSARAEQVVELRMFAGMTTAEIAHALGVTTRTIERDLQSVRDLLTSELQMRQERP